MSENTWGPLCKCKNCGHEERIRLRRGAKISLAICTKCGHTGFKRWTQFEQDKEKKP